MLVSHGNRKRNVLLLVLPLYRDQLRLVSDFFRLLAVLVGHSQFKIRVIPPTIQSVGHIAFTFVRNLSDRKAVGQPCSDPLKKQIVEGPLDHLFLVTHYYK